MLKRRASLRCCGEARDGFDDDRREALGDREVIGSTERVGAEIREGEPGDAARRSRDYERAPFHGKGRAGAGCAIGQLGKGVFERVVRGLVERVVVDRLAVQPGEPVVAPAVELKHIELLFEQRDERQKPLALQAMLVELVRRAVRGRDDHNPGLEKRPEQTLEDHRIGNVVDLKLVEAQQRRLGCEITRDLGDRLVGLGAPLPLDPVVHLDHEGVEMHPPLA